MTITHSRELVKFNNIPERLRSIAQWIVWKYNKDKVLKNGKHPKMPIDASTGRAHDASDPDIWLSFEDAVKASEGYDGIGLYPTADLNLTCVDVDVDDGGEVLSYFKTYAERSPSGVGYHVWMYGHPGGDDKHVDYEGTKVEVYPTGQFITFTGDAINDYGVEDCESNLRTFYKYCISSKPKPLGTPVIHNPIPNDGLQHKQGIPNDDETALVKARNARNGAKFVALYDRGVWTGDESRDTLSLLQMLTYWTNCDAEQMDRLFRGSALMRDKWDDRRVHSTWGRYEIDKAIATFKGNLTVPNEKNTPAPNDTTETIPNEVKETVPNEVKETVPNGIDWSYAGGETDRRVVAYMMQHGACDGPVSIGEAQMETELGITRKTIRKSIKRLLDRFGDWFKRYDREDILSTYSYEVLIADAPESLSQRGGDKGGELLVNNNAQLSNCASYSVYGFVGNKSTSYISNEDSGIATDPLANDKTTDTPPNPYKP